eukprot:2529118-Rhodomonas_salina.1
MAKMRRYLEHQTDYLGLSLALPCGTSVPDPGQAGQKRIMPVPGIALRSYRNIGALLCPYRISNGVRAGSWAASHRTRTQHRTHRRRDPGSGIHYFSKGQRGANCTCVVVQDLKLKLARLLAVTGP